MSNWVPLHSDIPTRSELSQWRKTLNLSKYDLVKAASQDIGRTEAETFWLEWLQVDGAIRFLKKHSKKVFEPQKLSTGFRFYMGSRHVVQRRIPYGHVLIVGTWNFPLGIHLSQILFTLAAGNKVTYKPSPFAPETGRAIERVCKLLVGDRFTLWEGASNGEVTEKIAQGIYQLVLFTGGSGGAQALALACAKAMTPFIPEGSGVESVFLSEEGASHFSHHVDHLLWGLYHNSGQTCVAPRFWLVPQRNLENVWDETIEALTLAPKSFTDHRPPLKNENVRAESTAWEKWVESQHPYKSHRNNKSFSLFYLGDVKKLSREVPAAFGPSAVIVGYSSVEDALDWFKSNPWSLMSSIMGSLNGVEKKTLSRIDTSLISINETVVSAGDASLPFGGRGKSGYGVWRGVEGLRQLSRAQTWVEVKPWFGISQLLIKPGLQTIEILNKLLFRKKIL